MTKKIALAALAAIMALTVAQGASAHRDPTPDQNRCDTWYRQNHTTAPGTSHDHTNPSSDTNAGVVYLHNHGGHYVLRGDAFYVEVVGGQGYRGPSPTGQSNPGQGGYVQGEVDPGMGVPDADFHANTFAPDVDHPPSDPNAVPNWANGYNYAACLNVANSKLADVKK